MRSYRYICLRPCASLRAAFFTILTSVQIAPCQAPTAPPKSFVPVTDQMLENPRPDDWLTWRATPNGWGYSPLKQINTSNVGELKMVWSRALRAGYQETTPLIYDGIMYLANVNDMIQALDARTGEIKWQYRRNLPNDLNNYFPVPQGRKRNIAIYRDKIIAAGSDSVLYALDAKTGETVWETRIADYKTGVSQTSGPIIAGGRAISGRSCSPYVNSETCAITAHDAMTGKLLWTRPTIPRPGEPGDETWGEVPFENRRHVGAWMPATYDPELDLIYIGTSVTSPAPKFMLAGNDKKYLYHNCTLALDGKTGEIKWFYQHLVDHWDMDHAFERMLVDLPVSPDVRSVPWRNPRLKSGERRSVVTGIPGKSGVIYTLDRRTGEFLWARPTVFQNLIESIDGATGEVKGNPAVLFDKIGDERLICPSSHGGKDWQAGSFNPVTKVMFQPLQNTCMKTTAIKEEKPFYAIERKFELAPQMTKVGTIYAVSMQTGTVVWKYEDASATASIVATGGGLVFSGNAKGEFFALDQRSGRRLWDVYLGSPIAGFSVVFGADGQEYVAVTTGTSIHTYEYHQLAEKDAWPVANNIFVFALPKRR